MTHCQLKTADLVDHARDLTAIVGDGTHILKTLETDQEIGSVTQETDSNFREIETRHRTIDHEVDSLQTRCVIFVGDVVTYRDGAGKEIKLDFRLIEHLEIIGAVA
ncbi:MAG: hypothetical protein GY820_35985 [Gammaproteobacteria bacterium]|nr:hypothetical protein [Gammaproteobacteria bacterium]